MIGEKFGKLTVIGIYGKKNKHGRMHYLCKCSCGNEKVVSRGNLRSGHTKSCGCLTHRASPRRVDLSGKKFGSLTALTFLTNNDKGTTIWRCQCDCGNYTNVSYNNLISGNTKTCGCLTEKHGDVKTRLYKCWQDMKSRCYYHKDNNYCNYGARGITVCKEWKDSYISFKKWALENGYSEKLTIDRIDCNGNYEPNNCRWATLEEQGNNKRNNKLVEYNGELMTLSQFAKKYAIPKGISYKTVHRKYTYLNYTLEQILKQKK